MTRWLVALGAIALLCAAASGQDRQPPAFRLGGIMPGGLRETATESWGTFDFSLTNYTDTDRQARVLMSYVGQPDVQYGRDVWMPARSSVKSWLLVGPAPAQDRQRSREVQVLLYERTGGRDVLILPPGEARVRGRGVTYAKREPFTVVLLDETDEAHVPGRPPQPEPWTDEVVRCVTTFRAARKLSDFVHEIRTGPLPATDEAFDGIDHLVLASDRIAEDPVGTAALRRWLERGGKLWVMLDRVSPDVLAPLLGDAIDFQVVDRVSLTTFKVEAPPEARDLEEPKVQDHERPVAFARVLLPPGERAPHSVNGWPAWFSRAVGRGLVVFTALGPRAWLAPRGPKAPPSPFKKLPSLPLPTGPFDVLAAELHPSREAEGFQVESFGPLLTEEIGYAMVGRGTVALVFAAFLLAALGLGLALRQARRPELRGWLGPVAALGTAAVFVGLGVSARRAAAPTLAVAQIVDAVSGKDEAAVHGLLAAYRPDSGPAEVGASHGGMFTLDATGLEGQTRRLILTDLDAWHWDNLALPAGVRLGPFHYTAPTGAPLTAVASFGPEGIEGTVSAGPFHGLADGLLCPPGARRLALRLEPEGAFRAGRDDILPKGQYLAGALLSDRQQRRRDVYQALLKSPAAGRLAGQAVVLAWAEPIDMHFTLAAEARLAGTALLIVPLRLERPGPGVRVTIPGPLIPCRHIVEAGGLTGVASAPVPSEGSDKADLHLRFQLPAEVLPLTIERARLVARIDAPGRRVTLAARPDGKPEAAPGVDSPFEPLRLDLQEPRLLRLDSDGGLHVQLSIGGTPQVGTSQARAGLAPERWTIHYLELEVTGRTGR
jgi:hypothetical protein